jgi:hypothetical protein
MPVCLAALFAAVVLPLTLAWAQDSTVVPSSAQAVPPAMACGADPARPDRLVATAPGLALAIVPELWPIPVGQHFAVELTLCAGHPGATWPGLMSLDADMPLHRHGMNYRASIEPLGAGRYRARGLMFHMPGRWRFIAEVGEPNGATQRLMLGVDVP